LNEINVALWLVVLEFGGIAIAAVLPAAAFKLITEFGVVVSMITLPVMDPSTVLPVIV
jgi:hypothetical protein